ncbi:hypothetical protein RJT34_04584 [Clitoria ternatea]|uniref:Uncharacterized protein n=1 Tax=Clitoria ternatea TaxID=43366 RepID=A0AAN9KNT4_CLITE
MDPRISFSNDFVVPQQAIKHENIYREAPVSSDFEFSVKNYSMISADEVFFKGMLLPLKNDTSNKKVVTLRDELLMNDDYEETLPKLPKLPKSSNRWKERLGLRRASSKKDKNKGDEKASSFGQGDHINVSKDNMELFYEEGGVSCRSK